MFRVAADCVVLLHVMFVLFVVLGGLTVLRCHRIAWLHVPAAAWGAIVELRGYVCPLTPLENELRQRAGGPEYAGDFVEHYILPVLYPDNLTVRRQLVLGALVIAVNTAIYGYLLLSRLRKR